MVDDERYVVGMLVAVDRPDGGSLAAGVSGGTAGLKRGSPGHGRSCSPAVAGHCAGGTVLVPCGGGQVVRPDARQYRITPTRTTMTPTITSAQVVIRSASYAVCESPMATWLVSV